MQNTKTMFSNENTYNCNRYLIYKRISLFFLILLVGVILGGCKKVEDVTYDKDMLDEIEESENKVLLNDSEIEVEEYTIGSVKRGNMEVEITNKGYLYYPNRERIVYQEPHVEATVQEILVNLNDMVEEGDKIASLVYSIDPIELEKKRIELKRSKENLDFAKEEANIELKKLKEKYEKEEDKIKAVQEKSNYDNRKIMLDDMIKDMESQHQLVYENTKSYEDKLNIGYITAPISGQITELEKTKVGQIIKPYHYFGMIDDQSEVYLAIDNEQGMFRYNMEVTVRVTNKGNTKDSEVDNYKGIVMTGSELLSWQLHSPKTYIRLIDGKLEDLVGKTVLVNGYTKQLKDVLLVDKTGVGFEKKVPFIAYHSDEGIAYKRNFVIGTSDSYNYVVMDGLENNMNLRLGIKK